MSKQPAKSLRRNNRTPDEQNPDENPDASANTDDEPTADAGSTADEGSQDDDDNAEEASQESGAVIDAPQPAHLQDPNAEAPGDWTSIPNAPSDGIVIGPNEKVRVDGEMEKDGTTLVLSRPVYRAFLPKGSKRWSFALLYPKGHRIPQSQVQRLDQSK